MRIVIIEDEMKIRNGMAKLISAHTAHSVVGEAKNGREGLELILRLRPELVISDIKMPVMDGLQLLEELDRLGIHCHFIILSGYSEFEYARKAIRYGVDDYLLKPLGPEELIRMLDKVQSLLDEEEQRQAETAEGLLRSLLLGGHGGPNHPGPADTLRKSGGFSEDKPCYLVAGYLGDSGVGYANTLPGLWEKMKETYPSYRIYYVMMENVRQMFCLIQGDVTEEELEAKLQRRVYMNLEKGDCPVWAMEPLACLEELESKGKLLRERQLCGMRLGYRTVITAKKAAALRFQEYEYPKQLEQELRTAVCGGSAEQLLQTSENIKERLRAMEWEPRYFRHAYGMLVNFAGTIFQDTSAAGARALQNLDTGRLVADAVTLGELEQCFDRVIRMIAESKDTREDIRNYAILRAIRYIKDHYQENISLEQLAAYLEMTPEYLSTLFNKEVGINFTAFLKQFRISHAKRLLKGTDRKICEIAVAVGYHDPKYFNRVFKEETGVSPGDYRQN